MKSEIPKVYNPKKVEDKIYALWQRSGFFNPDRLPGKRKRAYTILLPPPNVTGELHMGHALNATVQDILIRWKRLQGYKTLWLPGTDHAGIATQVMVEKELKKEGKSRFYLGREKFIERVWQWKEKYGNIILEQFKKLGCSCDWSRAKFTMDREYSKAVKVAFLHYYKKGWIYQGERPINFCPRCQTSLSDLEIEYAEEKGNLWYIRYPLKPLTYNLKPKTFITVATTRPETMLGDTAVAVNPKDIRYKNFVGKKVILPLAGREIPIISDRLVDPKFGTGAVKITPAHDLKDYEIGIKHNLKIVQVIDERGQITKEAPLPYQGLKVLEARKKIVEDLEKLGLLEKIEDYKISIPKCYRCSTTIEVIPSKQWFLKMNDLAKMAIKAVNNEKVKFIPRRWEKVYFDWLTNIKDWCISRQLWWGHQIPIWYCGGLVKKSPKKMGFHEEVVPQVFKGKTKTYRLLDHGFKVGDKVVFENSQTKTYFGYGIITDVKEMKINQIDYKDKTHYTTYRNLKELILAFKLRNPEKKVTPKTKTYLYAYEFHPFTKKDAEEGCGQAIASINKPRRCPACGGINFQQDQDVLDTWFSSALWPIATLGWPERTKDLKKFYPTDVLSTARDIINLWVTRMIFSGIEFMKKIPFQDVFVHPTVLTREGKRMSKSLGTGIDPMDLIQKYGADATRIGICWQIRAGQDIRFGEDHIIMGRKFCNKIWNATRFVLQQISKSKIKNQKSKSQIKIQKLNKNKLTQADKRILKALNRTTESVNKDLENFQFGKATQTLYDFFWHDFCDKYIEESKKQLTDNFHDREKNQRKTEEILVYVLFASLKLLHPFLPFITEEIYQKLPLKNKKRGLMIENWPK